MISGGRKRPVIGVVAAQAADIEQRQILKGIIEQAKICNADIAVISNVYNLERPDNEFSCENKIYDLIRAHDISGIILIGEAILNKQLRQIIMNRLLELNVPVVNAGTKLSEFSDDNFIYINTDDVKDMEEITDHLIEVHGFTDIDMISGRPYEEASLLRTEGYKRSLEKHGISCSSSKIHYGNFWINSGEEFARKYALGELTMPQAVICANDYMAYGLLDGFAEYNIHVPDDITVIGYEYIRQRLYHNPVLTTYRRNRTNLGREALRVLINKITGKEDNKKICLKGDIITGNTCSCGVCVGEYNAELNDARYEQLYNGLDLFSQFEQKLTESRTMSEYVSVCREFSYLIRNVRGIFLCLYEDWCSIGAGHEQDTEIMNCYVINDRQKLKDKQIFFNSSDFTALFEDYPEPAAYYINPVFFSDRFMGYIILQYDTPDTYDYIFRNWMKNASNALEFLRMKNDIGYLNKCQSLSLIHDSMTGLYNRKGFEYALGSAVSSSDCDRITVVLMRTELFSDSLQPGKQEKRYTVSSEAAGAVKKLAGSEREVCGRLADNLFAVGVFINCDSKNIRSLTDDLTTLMIHLPSYVRECGLNSFLCYERTYDTEGLDYAAMLDEMICSLNDRASTMTPIMNLAHYSDFQKVRNSIYINPAADYSSDEICQKLCLSTGYFRNMYKEYFGVSFHKDCIISRMSLAKYLLITTSMSITAIALKCGYEDEKYFMRLFQKTTMLSPNKYRSVHQLTK